LTKPDLAITNIILNPSVPSVRENAAITLEITNLGAALPKEQVPTVNVAIEGLGLKINLVSYQLKNGIGAGETVKLVENNNGPWVGRFGFTAEQAGKLRITAKIDAENKIAEEEEFKNNTLTKTFEIKRPAKLADFALERAMRSYGWYAHSDSVLAVLAQARSFEADAQNAVFKGILNGWNPKRKATTNDAGKALLVSLKDIVSDDLKSKFAALMESYGATDAGQIDPNLQVIKLKAIREAMKFDIKTFSVTAGKPVEIVFENPDAMQHNIVFGKPKSMDIIGNAADKMITQKDAAEKNYVPNLPNHIIAATPLVNPDQTYRLTFTAPTEPGDYPFVCTFPGHWRLMNGVMKVVKEEVKMSK
jgi:uncharacterized protein